MGFKVIAIDTANHGSTQGLPAGGANFGDYAELLGRVLDELGVKRAFFAGHSMGGRVVTQLCATDPDRALGVILIDAIVGETWDRLVNLGRVFPPAMAGVVVLLAVDVMATPPLSPTPSRPASSAVCSCPRWWATSSDPGACSDRPCRSCAAGAAAGCCSASRRSRCRWPPSTALVTSPSRSAPPRTPPAGATASSWWSRVPATPGRCATPRRSPPSSPTCSTVRSASPTAMPCAISVSTPTLPRWPRSTTPASCPTPPSGRSRRPLEFARLAARRRAPAYEYTVHPPREPIASLALIARFLTSALVG